jgi:hypothetical protein
MQLTVLNYICPACGYTWEDSFTDCSVMPLCACPSCEQPVHGCIHN